ncbi:hypothetical protein, partial [Acetitomaculum ruminis]
MKRNSIKKLGAVLIKSSDSSFFKIAGEKMFNKIKRNSSYLIAVFMVAFIFFSGQKVLAEGTFAPDAEGVYHINSLEDWDAFFETLGTGENFEGKMVCLEDDLNIKAKTYENYAKLFFRGIFDGKGHKITYSNDTMSEESVLFPMVIRNSTIKNLEVYAKDCTLVAGENGTGRGIIFNNYGGGDSEPIAFDKIKIYGDIKVVLNNSKNNNIFCTGIETSSSKVSNCIVDLNYNIDEDSLTAFLQNNTGRNARIELCQFGALASTDVSYENCLALGGCTDSILKACEKLEEYYKTIKDMATRHTVIVAFAGGKNTCTQKNCFYNKDKSHLICGSEQGKANIKCLDDESMEKTEEELKNQDTFALYDLIDTWGMSEYINEGYPYLRALVNEDLVKLVEDIIALPEVNEIKLEDKEAI